MHCQKNFNFFISDFCTLKMLLECFDRKYQLKFCSFSVLKHILCTVKNLVSKYAYCGGYKSHSFKGGLIFLISIDHMHVKNP